MRKTKKIIAVELVLTLLICSLNIYAFASGNKITINVNGSKEYKEISDNLFGIFFEDINYSADGGLNADLIRNNSFEQKLAWAPDYDCRMEGWNVLNGNYTLKEENPINNNNPTYFHADSDCIVTNKGYPDDDSEYGIKLNKNEEYELSFYARNPECKTIKISLANENGKEAFSYDFTLTDEFKAINCKLKASAGGNFQLKISMVQDTDIDYFKLISTESFGYNDPVWKYTTLRKDLVQTLSDLNPSFMRFPGGCLTEGAYDWNYAYNWKDTLGPVEERVQIPNLWGYNQSREIGFYEYFCLSEYLGATPVPVVHAGLMCQSRGTWTMDINSEEFKTHIQDILDLIEYANGSTDTKWGAVRAENGHPEPFNMKYIAIGNENWMEDYWERFDVIYNAVKKAYPDITVISSSGAWPDGKEYDYAWEQIDEKYRDTIVDEHYYVAPWWVYDNYYRYDNYDRTGAKVFVGEYAVHRGGGDQITKNNLQVAIDEAVHMTSLVRNGDIVEMACYAPLFAREGYTQWAPDLIWFNSDSVVKTPSYYVQQLYMNNTGTAVVDSTLSDTTQNVYQVVSIDTKNKQIYITVVNSSSATKNIDINLSGFSNIDKVGEQRYIGSGLYNLANRTGTLSNLVTPEYQKFTVRNNTVSKVIGPHSLNIFCLSYDNQNTYADLGSNTDYKAGSDIKVYLFDYMEDFILWLQKTKLYKIIESAIK